MYTHQIINFIIFCLTNNNKRTKQEEKNTQQSLYNKTQRYYEKFIDDKRKEIFLSDIKINETMYNFEFVLQFVLLYNNV